MAWYNREDYVNKYDSFDSCYMTEEEAKDFHKRMEEADKVNAAENTQWTVTLSNGKTAVLTDHVCHNVVRVYDSAHTVVGIFLREELYNMPYHLMVEAVVKVDSGCCKIFAPACRMVELADKYGDWDCLRIKKYRVIGCDNYDNHKEAIRQARERYLASKS